MAYRELHGKVAMVTGGSAGIGAACARRLADEGMRVAVVDIDGDGAQRLAASLSEDALAIAADVSVEDDVARAIDQTIARCGQIDRAVLNAGIGGDAGPIAGSTTANFDRVFAIDVRGCYLTLRASLGHLLQRGEGGSIVVTASALALMGGPMYGTYTAAKHAILGLARSAALEVARDGIRVNALCPGYVDTHLMRLAEDVAGGERATARAAMESGIPLGRYGRPEEMASMVAYLLSDEAAYSTGGAYLVDGGVTAGPFAI